MNSYTLTTTLCENLQETEKTYNPTACCAEIIQYLEKVRAKSTQSRDLNDEEIEELEEDHQQATAALRVLRNTIFKNECLSDWDDFELPYREVFDV